VWTIARVVVIRGKMFQEQTLMFEAEENVAKLRIGIGDDAINLLMYCMCWCARTPVVHRILLPTKSYWLAMHSCRSFQTSLRRVQRNLWLRYSSVSLFVGFACWRELFLLKCIRTFCHCGYCVKAHLLFRDVTGLSGLPFCWYIMRGKWVEFNAPPDTVQVISDYMADLWCLLCITFLAVAVSSSATCSQFEEIKNSQNFAEMAGGFCCWGSEVTEKLGKKWSVTGETYNSLKFGGNVENVNCY